MCSAKDRYTLIEQSSNSRSTCMPYSQRNYTGIIGNDQKNNEQNFWEILYRIIGKILCIIYVCRRRPTCTSPLDHRRLLHC